MGHRRSEINQVVTQARLRHLVAYDPETGIFRWKMPRPACRPGDECGRIGRYGYREICVDGRLWPAHRLAFIYMLGECPDEIDHANRDKADNRWANLRGCTSQQNAGNSLARRCGGTKGVHFDASRAKWCAQIRDAGKKKNLGRFDTKAQAAAAYNQAARRVFGEFAACT